MRIYSPKIGADKDVYIYMVGSEHSDLSLGCMEVEVEVEVTLSWDKTMEYWDVPRSQLAMHI